MAAGIVAGAAEIRAERARILSALLTDVEALAEQAAARMPLEIPAYALQDARFFADVRDQVRRHYRVKLAALLEERAITPQDMPFVRPAAMRRARAGFALEDYLCAFRVGQGVFWQGVLDRAGDAPVGHEAALTLATPVMRYSDCAATSGRCWGGRRRTGCPPTSRSWSPAWRRCPRTRTPRSWPARRSPGSAGR